MIRQLQRRLTLLLTALIGAVLITVCVTAIYQSVSQKKELQESQFADNVNTLLVGLSVSGEDESTQWLNDLEQQYNSVLFVSRDGENLSFKAGYEPQTDREELYDLAMRQLDNEQLSSYERDGITQVIVQGTLEDDGEDYETGVQIEYGEDSWSEDDDVLIYSTEDGSLYSYNSKAVPDSQEEQTEASAGESEIEYAEAWTMSFMESRELETEGTHGEKYRLKYMEMTAEGMDDFSFLLLQDRSAEIREIRNIYIQYIAALVLGLAVIVYLSWKTAGLLVRPVADNLRRQTEFVASASHELRSPLAVIRSSLAAAEIVTEEQEAAKYRQNAESEAERMSRLVEDLLLLAGGDSGKWTVRKESVDLDTMLIEIDEQFAPLARNRKRSLQLQLPEEMLGEVRGDQARLKQILGIFLNNAMEYAPEHSQIELWAGKKKNGIEICVADHGKGISDEEKQHVFERFYRSDKSRTDKDHFGLGLSVARELAVLHGGDIIITDTPGGGATFRLRLPYPGIKHQ